MDFNDKNFIIIPGFAIAQYHLSGNELIAYSLIYGFTQDGESEFFGSHAYVAAALGITRDNARNVILRLIDKGLVLKRVEEINGVKFCRYRAILPDSKTMQDTLKQGIPSIETRHNNIEDNNSTNLSLRSKFVKATSENLCLFRDSKFADFETFRSHFTGPEFDGIDIAFYYGEIMDWSSAAGKKKRDWIATARNWIRGDMKAGKLRKVQGSMALDYLNDVKRWNS